MPAYSYKRKKMLNKTKKQFYDVESAVARAEGKQSLLRFGHTGQDKYKEEQSEYNWLHNIGKKNLQSMINKHYYKYDSKKVNFPAHKQKNILYPAYKRSTRRRRG